MIEMPSIDAARRMGEGADSFGVAATIASRSWIAFRIDVATVRLR